MHIDQAIWYPLRIAVSANASAMSASLSDRLHGWENGTVRPGGFASSPGRCRIRCWCDGPAVMLTTFMAQRTILPDRKQICDFISALSLHSGESQFQYLQLFCLLSDSSL